jgi:hypothetical protein
VHLAQPQKLLMCEFFYLLDSLFDHNWTLLKSKVSINLINSLAVW